ncbi:unnamed protein product, partial [Prorocentrum cordatum]
RRQQAACQTPCPCASRRAPPAPPRAPPARRMPAAVSVKVFSPAEAGKGEYFWGLGKSGETLELLTVSVTRQSRVSDVKAQIQEAHGTPAGQQRLLMFGQLMEDGRTMASYGMNDEGEAAGVSLCLHMTPKV